MNRVMLDLETLSLAPNALILSIGAVAFNFESNETTELYYVVDYTRGELGQFHCDMSTMKWWLKQEQAARDAVCSPGVPLTKVCEEFNAFWRATNAKEIWANGADFDIPILANAYNAARFGGPPWQYSQTRCYRTMRALAKQKNPDWKDPDFVGAYHNALADANHQVRTLRKIFGAMNLV